MTTQRSPILNVARWLVALVGCGLLAGRVSAQAPAVSPAPAFLQLPLYFEVVTAAAGDFQFIARGQSGAVQLAPQRAQLSLVRSSAGRIGRAARPEATVHGHSVVIEFSGANRQARLTGEAELPGRVNYFIGDRPEAWRSGVSTYARVRAQEIYPGIDLVYYGNQSRLEYDFIVQPGVSPDAIAFRVRGADQLRVDANGDLVMTLGQEEVRQLKPVAYQESDGVRREVAASYRLRGQTVTFAIGEYDPDRLLVIDPILTLMTFFNGSGPDIAWDTALHTDGTNGYLYVAGETLSANLPATAGAFTNQYAGGSAFGGDAFVAKLDLSLAGSNLVWLTYLGGRSHDGALSLATDSAGNAYMTGYTASTNFPVVGSLRTNLNGGLFSSPTFQQVDAFVAKLSADGSNLVYSAFLGGGGVDEGFGIAVDGAGVAYVTGFTDSTNFPTANTGLTNQNGGSEAFVTSISADGQSFGYSLLLGGIATDRGEAITADAGGNAYVAGFTRSYDFPVTTNTAYQSLHNRTTNATTVADAFLLKVSPSGAVDYASFFGGNGDEIAFNLLRDAAGSLYVCGFTASTNFVVTATNISNQLATNSALPEAFVTKFDATLTNLVYSAVLGGSAKDEIWDLAVDSAGRVWFVGDTLSQNLAVTNTGSFLNPVHSGSTDAVIGRLNATGTALDHLGYLGGSGADLAYAMRIDAADTVYFVGQNGSPNFPTAPPLGGTADGFVARIINGDLSIAEAGDDVVLTWPGFTPDFQLQTVLQLPPTNGWSVVSNAPAIVNGHNTVTLPVTNDASFFRLYQP